MASLKTDEALLTEDGENLGIMIGTDWFNQMYDQNYNMDCTIEGAQSVPDLDATPFLGQGNYSTIGTVPNWMSQNILNGGNLKLQKLSGTYTSGDAHLDQGEISQHSPAASTSSSYFSAFTEYEERPETPRDATYKKLLASLGITERQLQEFSVKKLNNFLKSNGLSKENQQQIKNRRRTLKNRGYAQSCRVKRINQKKSLEVQNQELFEELHQLKIGLEKAKKERNYYKSKLVQLAKLVKEDKRKVS